MFASSAILLLSFAMSNGFTAKPPLLALNLKCTVKPSLRSKWIAAIKEDQLCTRRDEPGNLQFVIGQDVDDENTFHLHEEFKSLAAFEDHCASPHFATYDKFVQEEEPFVGPPEMCFYRPLEEDGRISEEKRAIHQNAFGLNVNLYPKAEVREEFLSVISNNKKGTDDTEELALQYTYGESVTVEGMADGVPNTFHFHEQYTGKNHGKEGFDAHATTYHFAMWEEFVGTDPFEKHPEVYFFRILE